MELPAAKTRELSAPFHLQTVPASSPNSHIGSGMLTHASGGRPSTCHHMSC